MKTTRLNTILSLLMVFAVGCNKPDEPNNGSGNNGTNNSDVRVTTYTPQDISYSTAVCGGDAIAIQGLSLTEIGVCWGKFIADNGCSIFLPCDCWSSTLVTDHYYNGVLIGARPDIARLLVVHDHCFVNYEDRDHGISIRPVFSVNK